MIFVNFKKAYDLFHKRTLWNILGKFKYSENLANLVKAILEKTEIKIKVEISLSQSVFYITRLKQADLLFLILFNMILEKVVKTINIEEGFILGKSRKYLDLCR